MRKLIIGSRIKVKDVESYVSAVRDLKFRQLPAYENLPEELLRDDILTVSTALREANYNGPIITKDVLGFINKNLDNDKYVVYGHGEISLAEWLALTNEHVLLIYPRGSRDYVPVSNELLSLNCPEKWKPLCRPFTCGADKYKLPAKIRTKQDEYGQDGRTAIIPLIGINSKQVASTIIARDTASMLAKGDAFRLKYVFVLDGRNSLGISLEDPADALNKVGSFVFDLTSDMCGKNPINTPRRYSLNCKSYETKIVGNSHYLLGVFTLKVGEASKDIKDKPPWKDLPDLVVYNTKGIPPSERATTSTLDDAPPPRERVSPPSAEQINAFIENLDRIMGQRLPSPNIPMSEVDQAIREGVASLSDELRLLPGSLRLARRLGNLLMRMRQEGNPCISRQYILTSYVTLNTTLRGTNPEILQQAEEHELEGQVFDAVARVL